ncbi:ABC transporter G family member 37 [Lathyrus oleraceus]|uniref:ABC transporter G member 37 n=1 Tax=Pisum sativum TaxID=3888 RepID=A0A9D4XCU5_PEA|nr:ABC transporter G family member 37-like [Pisum sativum]KAI5418691.1 ABC transporter G member 37 [Pisum sativum]
MELTPRGRNQGHVVTFDRDADSFVEEDKELQSKWAAIEKLPTFKRIKTSFVDEITQEESGSRWQRSSSKRVVDVTKLGAVDKRLFIDKLIKHIENDNLNLLQKLRERMERVNVKLPSVEVRYKNLNVEAECEVVQGKPLPTLWNSFFSLFSDLVKTISCSSQETKLGILKDVSGIIKPARLTLLLGPPSCGKTTLLMALAGKLDQSLEVSGEICYNGHRLDEFVPQKTSAYISQYDLHIPEMTVRETIDFSARCQGVGSRAGHVPTATDMPTANDMPTASDMPAPTATDMTVPTNVPVPTDPQPPTDMPVPTIMSQTGSSVAASITKQSRKRVEKKPIIKRRQSERIKLSWFKRPITGEGISSDKPITLPENEDIPTSK